ncbi:InlB B-repeat-containing protein [Cellulomonas denverensis]|uniref:InlB B-repeat-containing protein n=1 Tax=Cellulomonas denverensis TaxID=264297 RepID=UPI0035E7450C
MSPRVFLPAAALAAVCLVAGAGSASADPAGSFADLADAFADPSAVGGEVTLDADLAQGASPKLTLAAGQSLTLDLNGFDLTTSEVTLAAGSALTITDSSTGTPGTFAASWDSVDPAYPATDAAIALENATLTIEGRAHVTVDAGDPDNIQGSRTIVTAGIGVTSGTGTVTIGGDAVVDARAWETAIAVGGTGLRPGQPPVGTLVVEDNARVTAHSQFGAGIGGRTAQDGGDITITDHAVVEATSYQGAGIGGGVSGGNGGTVRIDGDANVTAVSKAGATGGSLALGAGIGGGHAAQRDAGARFEGGNGGDVTIGGNAVVVATSERLGAGIGAGDQGVDGGSLHVTGDATVTATSGLAGAGIGGGSGDGTWTEDGGGADVVLDGGTTTAINTTRPYQTSAVGSGSDGTDFGSLEINSPATLVIPDGAELRIPEGVTVTGDGEIRGDGNVVNEGAVVLPTENLDWADLSFAPNNYLTTFHANGGQGTAEVRTFATSFNAGARSLPDSPTRTGFDHIGWADTVDGLPATRSSVSFDADTPLTGDRTVYAQWLSGTTTAATATDTARPGQDVPVQATVAAADPAAGVPQGTAQLFVDDQAVGDPVPVAADGTAELTYPGAVVGTHTLRVEFIPGEVIWSASTSPDLGVDITTTPAGNTTQDNDNDKGTGTASTASTGNLATTGASPIALWAGLAVVLLGAGTATVLIARRRARTH